MVLSLHLVVAADRSGDTDFDGHTDLPGNLVAVLSHNILAVLNIGGVHDSVVLSVARLVVLGVAGGVSGRVVDRGADLLAVAVVPAVAVAGSCCGKPEGKEGQGKVQHS